MHMMARTLVAGLAMLAVARGEEIVFFRASSAGPDAWSWGMAKAKPQGAELRVSEANPDANYGDVYVSDRFPYVAGGLVELDVSAVESGTYTLQLLGFQGDAHVSTAEPVKSVAQAGVQRVKLPVAGLSPDTQSLMFKLWVGDAEGAASRVKELVYRVPVATEGATLDERFRDPAVWRVEADRLSVAVEPAGARLQLQGAQTFGPAGHTRALPVTRAGLLLVHIASIQGTLTVQLDTFDASGAHVGAVDVIKHAGAGWQAASLASVEWPAGATTYSIKLWLGGSAGATALLDRLLVVP